MRAEVQFEALPIALGAAGGAKGAESAVAARAPGAQLGRPAGPAVHSVPLGSSPPVWQIMNEIIREYKKFSQLGLAIAGNFRLALKSSFLVRTKDRFAQRPTYRFTLSSKEKLDNLQMVGFEDGF